MGLNRSGSNPRAVSKGKTRPCWKRKRPLRGRVVHFHTTFNNTKSISVNPIQQGNVPCGGKVPGTVWLPRGERRKKARPLSGPPGLAAEPLGPYRKRLNKRTGLKEAGHLRQGEPGPGAKTSGAIAPPGYLCWFPESPFVGGFKPHFRRKRVVPAPRGKKRRDFRGITGEIVARKYWPRP